MQWAFDERFLASHSLHVHANGLELTFQIRFATSKYRSLDDYQYYFRGALYCIFYYDKGAQSPILII